MPSRQCLRCSGVELDFLQGTFEKIYFLDLPCQEALQLTDFLG